MELRQFTAEELDVILKKILRAEKMQASIKKKSEVCGPVDWSYRVHRLHLSKEVKPSYNECPGYDDK